MVYIFYWMCYVCSNGKSYSLLKLTENFNSVAFEVFATAVITKFVFGIHKQFRKYQKHMERKYFETNIIGWNVFNRQQSRNCVERVSLEMPVEEVVSMKELFADDSKLLEKVMQAAQNAPSEPFLDFMVVLEPSRRDDFLRRIINRVSQSVKSSQWPYYASSKKKFRPKVETENALVLVTCEKDQGYALNNHVRTWLIFPSELEWLRSLSQEELDAIEVAHDTHRIRIQNLKKWADWEFEHKDDHSKKMSGSLILPWS